MNVNLLSIGQLCDNGCTVTFTQRRETVTKNNVILMTAQRNPNNGMWVYEFEQDNMAKKQTTVMKNVYEITKMKELVMFMHSAA